MSCMQNAQVPNCPELDCSQAGGDQGGGQASAGVGAGADEVEVVVAGVPVVGAEAELVAYLTPARDALRQSAGK
jgi:hypothetical protein